VSVIIERMSVTIRPLLPDDAAPAAAAAHTALERLYREELTPEEMANRSAGGTARVAHLQRTDPGGCWVAEIDGQIVGAAISIIREGVWGLSLLAVLPDFQGRGIGTRLYAPALAYGADEPGGIILSFSHPAAMRRYARTPGCRLLPTVGFSGAWDPCRAPAALRCRPGNLAADAQTIDGASRHVRGASHMRDLPSALGRPGAMLLVIEGEGFACCRNDALWLLAAHTEAAAEDLLWGTITSGSRRGTFTYDFVTAENQWAIRVGLEAGLAIAPCGPIFVRGQLGSMAPYLPSGSYL
jgi:ribosomal protein S18 acetylase RimI-like enzyme